MLYRHKKTGGIYQMQMIVTNEANLEPLVIYSDYQTGTLWSRPAKEFFDGRYERVISDYVTYDDGEDEGPVH